MMKIDGKFISVDDVEKAIKVINEEFIAPYQKYLRASGSDGVRQHWKDGKLEAFAFPTKYAASRGKLDVSATQHEMGHFVTVPEARCIRNGFGFGGGVPILGLGNPYDPRNRMMLGNASATVEAKAMAWEVILTRDLHGITLDYDDIAYSLVYTQDFLNYEGTNEKERLRWAAEKIIRYVNEFGTVDDFRSLWHARCKKLPDLFRREEIRLNLYEESPVFREEVPHVYEGWHAIIEERTKENVSLFTVALKKDAPEDWEESEGVYEDFDTYDQAYRWIARVREAHGYEPPASRTTVPAMKAS